MKRRKFLHYTGLGIAGTSLTTNNIKALGSQKVTSSESSDVIVVGAGTFGAWTAYHLLNRGAKVTLIDAYGPGNSRASSGGETRLIQADNDNETYVKSAIRSYQLWKQLEEESGHQIVLSTGRLSMAKLDVYRDHVLKRKQQHKSQGIDNTELLSQDEISYRWPQIFSEDIACAMYNDGGPSGSTLMARKGIQTVANLFEKKGGTIVIGKATPVKNNGRIDGVSINEDQVLNAQQYVFACGPWLPKLFPELLLPKLQVQRRDVIFVGIPSGDDRFSHPNLPEWSVYGSGFYGFPDIEGRGLKVAPYPDYNTIDPDLDERLINPYQVKRTHDFVKERFPALKDQPVIEGRVCQITNSVDSNFIVDLHPEIENTWIMGGGSGHGFKHGPFVGEHAAQRILGLDYDNNISEDFKLKEGSF